MRLIAKEKRRINNSITHGWQGLFPLKEQKTKFPKITEDTIRWANSRS